MIALVCLLPLLFDTVVLLFDRFRERFLDGAAAVLAVTELRNPRTRIRSLAVALTGAIAVFGAVAVGGTQVNLREGLRGSARGIDAGADIWIAPASQTSLLTTTPFRGIDTGAIARVTGVASMGAYRGSFLDWGTRRLWVLAPLSPTPRTRSRPGSWSTPTSWRSPKRGCAPAVGLSSPKRSPANTTCVWAAASCCSAPDPHADASRGARHQPRLVSGRDRPGRPRLCEGLGERRTERLRGPGRARILCGCRAAQPGASDQPRDGTSQETVGERRQRHYAR